MTIDRVAEIGLTMFLAATTTSLAVVQFDESGIATLGITIGVSSVVGYFSAQMTINVRLAELRTEITLLRNELHRYYATRTPSDD